MIKKAVLHRYIRKSHRYLGLFLGIQFLAWTLGGLYFSWTKIENIRGENLRRSPIDLPIEINNPSLGLLLDSLQQNEPSAAFSSIQVIPILGKGYYQIQMTAPIKKVLLFDMKTLSLKKALSKTEAIHVAQQSLVNPSPVEKVEYITKTNGHHEYREKPLPAYAIHFSAPNHTTVYVATELGTVQSYRNNAWRMFDFLWMLHIMDFENRDNFNNWLLRGFSLLGLFTILSGFILFFLTQKKNIQKMNLIRYCIVLITLLSACTNSDHHAELKNKTQSLSKEDSLKWAQDINNFKPENHANVMESILGKPTHNIKTIGILVYNGVNDLDVIGPRYILGQAMGVNTKLISINPGNIKTVMGVELVPNTVIDSITQLDILIIPGGFKGTVEAAYNKKVHRWIKKIDSSSIYTGAICTGVWILGATGLLEGKKASTNWYRENEFLKKYKAIPSNQRYTQDGKYWTSAGVTAGMDMSLAIMNDIYGSKYTQAIMLDMEYDPQPPIKGGTPEKSDAAVHWMMKAMYDGGINPLIDSLEKINPKK